MLYLLDANALIDAKRDYYPMHRVPEFWDWLVAMAIKGNLKVPVEIYEEVAAGDDDLAAWIKRTDVKSHLLLEEETSIDLVRRVVATGYATDLTDDEQEKFGNDPFLIAHALTEQQSRCVITTEVSRPKRQRANRHIPDVCKALGVRCEDTFFLIDALDFQTARHR